MRGMGFGEFYIDGFSQEEARREQGDVTPFMVSSTPSYFETVGLRILRGRTMAGGDVDGAPAEVVVNEAMARLAWPGRDPIGRCMHFGSRENPCYAVVGVVEDARWDAVIETQPRAQYYVPLGNLPTQGLTGRVLIVRAEPGLAGQIAREVQNALREAFPTANASAHAMTERLEPEYRPWRLGATLFLAFGFLALLVALVGIYSSVSYGVSQRTHEFGVRSALGAQVRTIIGQVVAEGLRTVALGVVLGIALALAAGRLLAAMLYGIAPGNPVVLLLVAGCLLVVAAIAAAVPAWRAGRVDPMTALRVE
jgi:hypothetical protein